MKNQVKAIEFKEVSKSYSLGKEGLKVLNKVSFSIEKGEFVAIMGPSGSGKSTLLHLMGCLDKPSEGSILINGEEVSSMDSDSLAEVRAKKIGFVFQAFNLLPNMSALQNVEIALAINEAKKENRIKKARELLKRFGLEKRENHKPSELSGGEKQRVAMARALANDPEIILADEPTGNLDSKSGKEVMETLEKLWKENNITIIVVTHEPNVASYCKRIIRLKDGEIIADEKKISTKNISQDIKLK